MKPIEVKKLIKPICGISSIITIATMMFPVYEPTFWGNLILASMITPCLISVFLMVFGFIVWSLTPAKWWKFEC